MKGYEEKAIWCIQPSYICQGALDLQTWKSEREFITDDTTRSPADVLEEDSTELSAHLIVSDTGLTTEEP